MVASQLLIIVYLAPFSSPKRGKETDAMVRCFVSWSLLCNGFIASTPKEWHIGGPG